MNDREFAIAEAHNNNEAAQVPVMGDAVAWLINSPPRRVHLSKSTEVGLNGATQEPLYLAPTNYIPATELASLREKAAMVDELQKRAERMQKALSDIAEWTDRYTKPGHPISNVARAAMQERQS